MTGFDRAALIAACARQGTVARVAVVEVRGSAPREVGAAMLVWADGFSGTIGGGALEHEAMTHARARLASPHQSLTRHALGPDLGQCCGGAVTLLTEVFDLQSAQQVPEDIFARGPGDMPLQIRRILADARSRGHVPEPSCIDAWVVEPVAHPTRRVWIWGAGHVGRALVGVLAPLPDIHITWIDTARARFPAAVPANVDIVPAAQPALMVAHAPRGAHHLIVTYSHALDLELCHRLLGHEFAYAGLIGSRTKWARFRKRLAALGHAAPRIAEITCPIGDPSLGKHPHAISLGVATELLTYRAPLHSIQKASG